MEEGKNDFKTTTISEDIVGEILQPLSMKSLARLKAVSKLWRSMIQLTYFSHKRLVHLGLQTYNVKLLVVDQPSSKLDKNSNSRSLILKTFSRDNDNNGQICLSASSIYTFHGNPIDKSQYKSIQVLGSCDGLVLVRIYDFSYIYLINPATREHHTLSPALLHYPPGRRSWPTMPFSAGFGKDIVTKTYEVVLMYGPYDNRDCFKIKVISLSNGEQRDVGFYSLSEYKIIDEQTSVYANGSLFWLISLKPWMSQTLSQLLILAIDLYTEKIRWISLPSSYTNHSHGIQMWPLNDHLCLSDVLQYPDLDVKWEKILSFNILNIGCLDANFWMIGLAAAYFRRIGENRDHVSFDRLRATSYSPTLISPSSLLI